jgi:hypothetical protein
MRNTADVKGSKPIAVYLQSISSESSINSLVAFYDIYGRKREVLFFYFVPDTTQELYSILFFLFQEHSEESKDCYDAVVA